jgi:hypothetical protein
MRKILWCLLLSALLVIVGFLLPWIWTFLTAH